MSPCAKKVGSAIILAVMVLFSMCLINAKVVVVIWTGAYILALSHAQPSLPPSGGRMVV